MEYKWRLNDMVAVLLLSIVAISPLPLGSNRPIFWLISAAIVFFALALFLFKLALHNKTMPITPRRMPFLAAIVFAYLAFLAVHSFYTGNAMASATPRASLLALIRTLSYVGFFFMFLQIVANEARARWVGTAIFLSVSSYAALGFLMVFAGVDLPDIFNRTEYIVDATATFVNRNSFATFLGFGILLGMGLVTRRLRDISGQTTGAIAQVLDIKVAGYLGLIALMLVTLISTNSRMGVAAFVFAAIIFMLMLLAKRAKFHLKAVLLITLSVFTLTAIAVGLYGGQLLDRLGSTENDFDVRFELYVQTWRMIWAQPWFGHGADSFSLTFQQYHQLPVSPDLVWDKAHNTYLTNWAETGVIFGSLPIVAALIIFIKLVRFTINHQRNFVFPMLAICVIVQAALHSLVDFSLEIQANMYLFLAILALGLSHALNAHTKDIKK